MHSLIRSDASGRRPYVWSGARTVAGRRSSPAARPESSTPRAGALRFDWSIRERSRAWPSAPTDEGSSPVGETAWRRIWNGFNGKLIHELAGHQGHVLDVAIGAGGAEVATASTDGTARIWDGVTGLLRAPLFGHTNFVRTVDFSPDGQSVVTASVDGTARTLGTERPPVGDARRAYRCGRGRTVLARRIHGHDRGRGRDGSDLGGRHSTDLGQSRARIPRSPRAGCDELRRSLESER